LPEERELISTAKRALANYSDMEELIRLGAYRKGADANVDRAIELNEPLEQFLSQAKDERSTFETTFQSLGTILAS